MKVFLEKIFKIDDDYQEILIDENNFSSVQLLQVFPRRESFKGLVYDDIYTIEPHSYYEILLKENTPSDFMNFNLHFKLLEAGLIFSGISKKTRSVYIYNPTDNHIFIRPNAIIGEIEW